MTPLWSQLINKFIYLLFIITGMWTCGAPASRRRALLLLLLGASKLGGCHIT